VKLADLYVQARRLTPRAARFAEKLLRSSPQIAYEVRHAMLVALLDLARAATAPTVTEWSALERPTKSKDASTHSDVVEARLFVEACASFTVEHWMERD
jgi:hypothetical protein